jgi:hypothetical protein
MALDPFPTNDQGQLVNPDYIQKEGDRIRASIAAGTYGAGTQQQGATAPIIAPVAPGVTTGPFGDSFFHQPSMWEQNQNPAQLRQGLKLSELVTSAASHKFALEEAQKNAPVKDAYELAKLAHETAATNAVGSTATFHRNQDAQVMQHVTGFADYMQGAPPVDSPDYAPYVLQGVKQFPRIAATGWGKQTLGKIAQEHDTIAGLTAQIPPGFEVSSVTAGGGKQTKVSAQRIGGAADAKTFKSTYGFPKTALDDATVLVGNYDPNTRQFKQDNNGTHVSVTTSGDKGKTAIMTTSAYESNGGKYSGDTKKARDAAASAAPTLSETPVKVSTPAEAQKLPVGQHYLDPDGKLRVR